MCFGATKSSIKILIIILIFMINLKVTKKETMKMTSVNQG